MNSHLRPTLAPHVRLQNDRATGEPVLLSPECIVTLNPTSHAIVLRCDGTKSLEEIALELALEYEAPVELLRQDVTDFLAELQSQNLILLS